MGDGLNIPTCVLKVNIQCCATCPEKVKKKLKKINDVYDIDIDAKNGLVYVRGIVEPSILIQTISEKVGKKAEVYSYEENHEIQNELLHQTCCFTDDSDVHNEVKDPISEGSKGSFSRHHHPQHGLRKKKHGFTGWFGKKSKRMFSKFGVRSGGGGGGYAKLSLPAPSLPPQS